MKILFITHYSSLYGANRSLLLLLEGLIEKNIHPLVILPKDGPLINELKRCNIRYHKIKFYAWMGVGSRIFFFKALLRFLANLALLPILLFYTIKFKPSIIYSNSSVTPIGIYLSKILRVPHIWHVRELGKLDYNLDYDFGKKYFYYLMRKSDIIISISEYVKENVFRGDWKNIIVITNGIYSENDLKKLDTKKDLDKDITFTFLIMSIIHPSKGIHDAIYALGLVRQEIDNIRLIICGHDEDKKYRKHLDELIEKFDLKEKVSFLGFVEKPYEIYKMTDAVLVCSRNEAWGRVAAEAMIAERPVIGYNGGGTKEIIIDNFNGLLYNDIEELSLCMKTIVKDKNLTNKLIANARDFALKRFNIKEFTTNILNAISKLAE